MTALIFLGLILFVFLMLFNTGEKR